MGGGCPRSTCIYTQQPGTVTNLCTHSGTSPLIHMSGLLVLEYLLSNVPSKIPAYASVNLHEATLEVGGRGQQWAKGFAKQQQAKALHIPKGRPLASSYITKSSLLVHHMGSHDLFYLMPRGQELVQFNLGLMPRKSMVLGLWSSSPPSPIYAPPPTP